MDRQCLFSVVSTIIEFWLVKLIRRIFVLQKELDKVPDLRMVL